MAKGRTLPSRRRVRTLKAEFWTERDIAGFSFRCRLLFGGLICAYVDDHGRELDDLRDIRAAVWPQNDDVTLEDVAEDLTALNVAGKVVRYEKNGMKLLAIRNWRKHQRVDHPKPSKYPAPPAHSRGSQESLGLFSENLAVDLNREGLDKDLKGGARGGGQAKAEQRSQATKAEANGETEKLGESKQAKELRARAEANAKITRSAAS